MSDPQVCVDNLRNIAETGSGDPRKTAAKIVHEFVADASKGDVRRLRARLEDTLDTVRYTTIPPSYLDQHSRWLAVLEGACAEMKAR
jgi:hypothetical protein